MQSLPLSNQGTALLSTRILIFQLALGQFLTSTTASFKELTHYFNPLHDASASGAGIEVPSCQHPEVLNKEGVGEASREEETHNHQDLKHDEIQPRGEKNEILSEIEMGQVLSLEDQEFERGN